MATTAALVSVQEYLTTVYEPECDYVDGVLEDRNVGEKDHGRRITLLGALLLAQEKKLGIFTLTDVRVQVKPTRFRVPDLCVVAGPEPPEQVLTRPPSLCIEILSPEDRMIRVQQRIDDFLEMGVAYVWVISPELRKAWVYTAQGAPMKPRTASCGLPIPTSRSGSTSCLPGCSREPGP